MTVELFATRLRCFPTVRDEAGHTSHCGSEILRDVGGALAPQRKTRRFTAPYLDAQMARHHLHPVQEKAEVADSAAVAANDPQVHILSWPAFRKAGLHTSAQRPLVAPHCSRSQPRQIKRFGGRPRQIGNVSSNCCQNCSLERANGSWPESL